jgi:flagellar motor switch protein FliN/FliY
MAEEEENLEDAVEDDAATDDDSVENLDDLDWSDVESDLKENREEVLAKAGEDEDAESGSDSGSQGGTKVAPSALEMDFLLDVQLNIAVEVGRSQMRIEDLLQLDQGSVLELESIVGQPLDIRGNNQLVARGEVVVINDKFAVRITDIVSPDDRFAAL